MSKTISKNNVIPTFFAVDDTYAPYLAVALKSISENSKSNKIAVYILVENLSEIHKNNLSALECENMSVEFVNLGERLKSMGNKLHLRDYYTSATYYRFFIPEMFPEYDKGIYLDCDITVTEDIANLYNHELGNNLVGAVTDEVITDIPVFTDYAEKFLGVKRNNYFNAGILVMNLRELRKVNIEYALQNLMEHFKFTVAQDQDYLNVLCSGKIKYLDKKWNKTAFPDSDRNKVPAIVHFKINWKPWHYENVAFEEFFWKYAKQTAYYTELLNQRSCYGKHNIERDKAQYENLKILAESETEKSLQPGYKTPMEFSVLNQEKLIVE